MSTFLQYLKSRTNQDQESARALNYLYLTESVYKVPAEKSISYIINTYESCLKTKDLLEAAISLRQKFKDLHISEDEMDDGSFFEDKKNFDWDSEGNDVLLWVAHVSEVLSLDPAKPFITMRTNDELAKGYAEIGRAWPRENIQTVATRFDRFYYHINRYSYRDMGGTKYLKSRLSSALFPVDFFDSRCELSSELLVSRSCFDLNTFIAQCAACMIFDTHSSNSSSILNILRILIPTIIPDVVLRYIEFSMKTPSKDQVQPQLAQYDIVRYKLNIDYTNINELYQEDVVAYIRELMGDEKPITRERLIDGGDIETKLTSKLASNHLEPAEKCIYV